jgi:hypothetical protein
VGYWTPGEDLRRSVRAARPAGIAVADAGAAEEALLVGARALVVEIDASTDLDDVAHIARLAVSAGARLEFSGVDPIALARARAAVGPR